jgi:anti-anti-sigma regulatory factor
MFGAKVIKIADGVLVHCKGRLVRSEAAFKLRDLVTAQAASGLRTIILDVSELEALEGGGLGMVVFLQRWAQDNGVQLKLTQPPDRVWERIKTAPSLARSVFPQTPQQVGGPLSGTVDTIKSILEAISTSPREATLKIRLTVLNLPAVPPHTKTPLQDC